MATKAETNTVYAAGLILGIGASVASDEPRRRIDHLTDMTVRRDRCPVIPTSATMG